ncbi:MAG: 4'-phosphopantetheinyl transferase superfamily protein [Bdellovibrionota bacterium]|nr:MAG: 4-phosphopantetheinyl transferase family protein [Pseudomonadota bacterium]
MRLGNDIVDLKCDAEIHPRFVQRILHPVEKVLYSGLSEAVDIWRIWAAKEAAFKAHRQGPSPVGFFIPSRWLVDLQLQKVFFGDEEYLLRFEVTADYIHATARSEDRPYSGRIYSSESELLPEEQKQKGQTLREELGLAKEAFKDAGGIPRLAFPYSLTHHGRHVAVVRAHQEFKDSTPP